MTTVKYYGSLHPKSKWLSSESFYEQVCQYLINFLINPNMKRIPFKPKC